MSAEDVWLKRINAGRERWLRLDAQREVRIRRPAHVTVGRLAADPVESVVLCVVDWRGPGFTAAGVLGDAHGSQDEAVPFIPAVWRALALDHPDWVSALLEAVEQDITAYAEKLKAHQGN